MPKQLKRVYLGDHVFKELIAMDEAPARGSAGKKDDDSGPRFGDLSAALDAAQAAIDAARQEVQSGIDSADGSFSFDTVRESITKARDCMDLLDGHLGGKRGASGEDEEQEESREDAYKHSRDSQVDHRRDFAPGSADSARGLALDHDPMTGHPRFKPPKLTRAQQQQRAKASGLVHAIFTPHE